MSEYRKIPSYKFTNRLSSPVEFMNRNIVLRLFSFQRIFQRKNKLIPESIIIKSRSHGCMHRRNIKIGVKMRMQDSNVAVSYDPFGFLLKFFEIDFFNDPPGTITPTCAKNGFHF